MVIGFVPKRWSCWTPSKLAMAFLNGSYFHHFLSGVIILQVHWYCNPHGNLVTQTIIKGIQNPLSDSSRRIPRFRIGRSFQANTSPQLRSSPGCLGWYFTRHRDLKEKNVKKTLGRHESLGNPPWNKQFASNNEKHISKHEEKLESLNKVKHKEWDNCQHIISLVTPWKINMEPKNHPIEKENHLANHHFQVPC